MRDAFGGAFMIRLILVFLIIYVFFIALALNYAQAFKVKNAVIAYLEDNEVTDLNNQTVVDKDAMEEYFEREIHGRMNYHVTVNCNNNRGGVDTGVTVPYCRNGIKIYQYNPNANESNKSGVYYRVTTGFGWSIPFINSLLWLSGRDGATTRGIWEISGETRVIVNE